MGNRKEFPLTGPNSKTFGTLAIFSKGKSTYLYAERFSKGKKYAGLFPCKDGAEAETKAKTILAGVKAGEFLLISKDAQKALAEYQTAKKAGKAKAETTKAKTTSAKKPSIVF